MNIAIIGAGPAGVMAGIQASKIKDSNITFFDFLSPLSTLLPTGGGRCNLAYAEFDNRELVKFYPRGEKFLLSVFSQFQEDASNQVHIRDNRRTKHFPLCKEEYCVKSGHGAPRLRVRRKLTGDKDMKDFPEW